jgi:succinoglycan biosynthesis transport protein ExoP
MNETTPSNRMNQGGARDFLAVLFRRRWVIGTVFAVTTLTVLAINLSQPLYFESTGKVIVKRGVKDNIMQGYMRTLTWEEELASEVETIKSGVIVERAQKLLDDKRAAEGRPTTTINQAKVDGSVLSKSNVLAMSYQDRNGKTAQEVADALIQAYMQYRRTEYTLAYPKEFFDTEIARVSKELDDWTKRREAYEQATGTVNLLVEGPVDAGFVQQQQLQLADVDRDLAIKRSQLGGIKGLVSSSTNADDLPFITNANVGNDNIITELKRKLGEARGRLKEMETVYVPTSPQLTQQRTEVEHLEGQLKIEVANRIRVGEGEVTVLEAKRAQILRSLNEGQSRMATYPERNARISEFETKIASLRKSYQELTESSDQAKISKATSPDWNVALLTPASKPYPKNQRDYVRLALAPIFSLIVGLGLAFFIDGLDSTLKSPREAEEALALPVLASLTDQRKKRRA